KKIMNSEMPRKPLDFINSFYIDRLREQGFTTKNGFINTKELIHSFNDYFPLEYLELMNSTVNIEKENTWLRRFVANNGHNRSTLRHLLFQEFLNLEVEDLFQAQNIIGRLSSEEVKRMPKFNRYERRKKWIKIINENPRANRFELMKIGKGLHTWIRKHDL